MVVFICKQQEALKLRDHDPLPTGVGCNHLSQTKHKDIKSCRCSSLDVAVEDRHPAGSGIFIACECSGLDRKRNIRDSGNTFVQKSRCDFVKMKTIQPPSIFSNRSAVMTMSWEAMNAMARIMPKCVLHEHGDKQLTEKIS